MGFFKKKAAPPVVVTKPQCKHKWKDFDWYLEVDFHDCEYGKGMIFNYTVIEPYVCVLCNERKNITLDKEHWEHCSQKEIDEEIKNLYKSLPQLRHRAIVENEINDFMMVDRSFLKNLEALTNPDLSVVPKIKT